ncbi:hypothetical protein HYW40_03140 [Candidatus Curtissbacteria bacterium]|nr:hypothetical protein [Candidatus Curtissbacteria bacterium]
MEKKAKSGQILILVLLVVVVALAVGLSVASRNLTNLKTSAQTEQSQKAFAAAEGGIEDVLSRLSEVATTIPAGGSTTQNVTVGGLVANVAIEASNIYELAIDLGTVGQVDLKNATGQMQIEWANATDPAEADQPASLEVTQVSQVGGSFSQSRTAWSGGNFGGRSEDGFASPNCTPAAGFKLCTRIPLDSGVISARIRPFWVKTTVKVTGVGQSLPVQTYNLVSTATTGSGVTRKVQVIRTALPTLPAAFDYVLFSSGDIAK